MPKCSKKTLVVGALGILAVLVVGAKGLSTEARLSDPNGSINAREFTLRCRNRNGKTYCIDYKTWQWHNAAKNEDVRRIMRAQEITEEQAYHNADDFVDVRDLLDVYPECDEYRVLSQRWTNCVGDLY